jgi:HD-GYP domain-containing protein (c-di-GMP phosphodiesterase class II)
MEALAFDIQCMIEADTDLAILAMLRLDSFDYTVAHALQTAVVCDVYGHAVGKSQEQRAELIQAALTMNIAMLELQRELEWQSTPPSPEQRRQIYEHPQRGRERLEALGVRNETWLRAVAEHHESPDGSGYPTGCLSASPEADILAVADRYCAMLSRRGLRDSMASNRAAQSLYCAVQGPRQSLATQLIDIFGQHPPGSLVRLVNGEIGIVIRRCNAHQSELVCAVATAAGEPLPELVLRNTGEPVHVIVGSVPDRDFKGTLDYLALRRMMG